MSNTTSNTSNFAIVAAGGRGMQTGLVTLGNRPTAAYALKTLQNHPMIEGIVLVRNEEDDEKFKNILEGYNTSKLITVVDSGKVRRQSMYKGLLALQKHLETSKLKCDTVLFHQVTNPLVTSAEITHVIETAREFGAAAVGRLVTDTVKIVVASDHCVIRTIHRSEPHIRSDIEVLCAPNRKVETELYQTEVPQAMHYKLAMDSYKVAMEDYARFTDDVQVIENKPDANVKIVPASPWNIRMATESDLIALSAFLSHWEQEEAKAVQ